MINERNQQTPLEKNFSEIFEKNGYEAVTLGHNVTVIVQPNHVLFRCRSVSLDFAKEQKLFNNSVIYINYEGVYIMKNESYCITGKAFVENNKLYIFTDSP